MAEKEDNAPLPQYDRAKCKTEIGFYSTLFHLSEIGKQSVLPAIVKEYNRETGIAKVQPLVTYVTDTKQGEVLVPRVEYSVSVVRFAHGGFVIDAPLFVGDTGWLVAADRNAKDAKKANSSILDADQTDGDAKNEGYKRPTDDSLASFEWGFFIPDTWGDTELTKEDGLVIKDVGAKSQIILKADDISIKHGDSIITIKDGEISVSAKDSNLVVSEGKFKANNSRSSISFDNNGISVRVGDKKILVSEQSISASIGDVIAKVENAMAHVQVGKNRVALTDGAITLNGENDTITIDENGPRFSGRIDTLFNLITDIRYDYATNQLQQRVVLAKKRGDFIVSTGEKTDWVKVDGGQAVAEYKP